LQKSHDVFINPFDFLGDFVINNQHDLAEKPVKNLTEVMKVGRQYFTIEEFAKAFMIPEGEVIWAITWNKIKAEKVDGKLMIPRSEILRLLRKVNPKFPEEALDEWEELNFGKQ